MGHNGDDGGAVNESMSGDGSSGAELLISDMQLARWNEVGEVMQQRRPALFALALAAAEATAAELASCPEHIDDVYKI